jgi:hypothetical protein
VSGVDIGPLLVVVQFVVVVAQLVVVLQSVVPQVVPQVLPPHWTPLPSEPPTRPPTGSSGEVQAAKTTLPVTIASKINPRSRSIWPEDSAPPAKR